MLDIKPSGDIIELKSGNIFLRVPRDSENIDILISLLQKWKNKISPEKKTEFEKKCKA